MYYNRFAWVIQKVRERPLLFFAILHAILFLAVSANLDGIYGLVGFAGLERQMATQMLSGQVPYSDFTCEYPPLALLSFLLPGLLSTVQPAYGFLFALEMLLLDLVVLFIIWKLASRLKMRIWYALAIYTLCLLAIGLVVTGRFDMLPATLVLVALYAFISGKNKTAWVVLALGMTAKLYPIIIAPLFALYLLRHQQYRKLVQGIAIFGGIVLVLNLPWIIINASGYWEFLSYHLERGLHAESSYGSVLLIGQMMGITQVDAAMTYGSWNLISPMADNLAQSSFYVTVIFLLITYAFYATRLWGKSGDIAEEKMFGNGAAELILRYSLLAVFIMLLTSKVFSPQFLIWLCPLIPLVRTRWRYIPWLLFLVIGGLSQYIYPHNYLEFEYATLGSELGKTYLIIMLAIRNFLLVAMAVIYLFPPRPSSVNAKREKGVVSSLTPSGIT